MSRPLDDPGRIFKLRARVLWTIIDWPGPGTTFGLKVMERRWLLDPMHIEVNVTKSLLKNMYGTKDGFPVRRDCEIAGMQKKGWLKIGQDGKPIKVKREETSWILDWQARKAINSLLCSTRFPTGYGTKLINCVNPQKDIKAPHELKSHDYHKIMQHVLSTALRASDHSARTSSLRKAVYEMSTIFRYVYGKEIKVSSIEEMKAHATQLMSLLEKVFPTDFFDIQVHLVGHLIDEVEYCGPIHARWM